MADAYRGRFAPSPTGPLHAGSLVAALASWLDARAARGHWLVRIEDVDRPRSLPGLGEHILQQLAQCGLRPDETVWWQSERDAAYSAALKQLLDASQAYPCGCTRSEIEAWWQARGIAHERHVERPYPGICREGLKGKPARAIRLRAQGVVSWQDRRLGPQQQDVGAAVGDFVLRRADGCFAYQLAVVVDDATQGITDVVRGEDLADNTPRQILLQRALGLPTPRYLHCALVWGDDGQKLSKQNGAQPLDLSDPLRALQAAAAVLQLPTLQASTTADWLGAATAAWAGMMRSPETRSSP